MLQDQAAPIKTDKAVLTKVASKVLTKANLPSFYTDTTNLPNTQEDYLLLYGRLPLVTRGLLYSPLIYLSRVGRSITAQVGLFLAAHG